MIELLNICCMEYMATQPDESFDLIIVDPPYFEVKGDFDFKWKSFAEYLEDVERWAIELARVLKSNGSLLWWGHAKKIAYSQIILDKYLKLENSLVWEKIECQAKIGIDEFRSFAPITERLLFYSKEIEMTGLEFIEKEYVAPRNPFAKELKRARLEKGVSINQVAEYGKFYGNVNHGGAVTNWERGYNVPMKDQWEILCDNLPIIRQEYEEIRQEYEDLRRPFNNELKLTDVMRFSQEGNVTGKHNHPTQKPPKLSRALIRTIGRKGGRALVPFMGSGTETIECFNFGMEVVATEIDEEYFTAAKKRIHDETRQVAMF
jgi:site-specific DNA-methyltransferase (adenine-specific)